MDMVTESKVSGVILIVLVFCWWKLRQPLIAPLKDKDRMSEAWLVENCYNEGKDGEE